VQRRASSGLILPVASAANDDHIVTCVVGPVTATPGLVTNTAHATGTFSATPYDSDDSTATYATTGLTIDKTATETSFTTVGDAINYSYLVTNSGFATLEGPVTVTDDKVAVTCPALVTVGDNDDFFDAGESLTCAAQYLVTIGDIGNGFVTNIAFASAEGVNSPNDSVTVNFVAVADVSITKTLTTAGPFVVGQTIEYELVVSNAGPSTATNVDVADTPTNLTITNVSGGGCAALPCTIASLASGANATITVTATISATGAFDNEASATGDEFDPDTTNNTDDTGNGGTAGDSADVSITKTLTTAGPFVVGQTIEYELVVSNAGPSTATNVDVADTPTNLTITNVSGGGCAALPCTIASLASGANATITVTATINATGAFDNEASATGDEFDPDTTNNTDDTGNGGTAGDSADVSITKTLTTAGPFVVGQTIEYELVVSNAGPSTATNVDVTDTPTNLTITNVSGGGCAALPCTIASLANGANATITVTATINATGAFDNEVSATGDEFDPDTTNNTDDTGNGGTAGDSADVSITKTLQTAGPYNAGGTIEYEIVVANAGPSTATNVQVTDTPANLTITNVSGGGCAALPCTIASLSSGANATITITATIDAAGAFDNEASVTADEFDPDTTNNTDDSGNDGSTESADVSITKALQTAGPFVVGQSIEYELVVSNAGPSTATSIQVTDTPTNLTITNVSGGGCAALPCTIASLASGASATITVTATIDTDGTFDNEASADATEFDPDTSNNTDDTGNGGTADPLADVSISKTLQTAGPFVAGQTVTYELVVANAGPSTATNVDVTDTPANLTITNVSGDGCAALPCTIASLASGANATITVTATIDADGAFDNEATVSADETDPDLSNNTDDTGNGGTADPLADVSITKTLQTAGPFVVGQTVTYELVVANAGPSTATNVDVTDTPTNLTITNVSGGGCAALPCTIASLASGASATITVQATIDANGTFDNEASVSADEADPDPSDNTDDTGNDGSTASADVSITKTLATAGPFTTGQTVTYELVVANAGPSTATNVQITDTPVNLTITNVSGGGCAALPCTIASLVSGASATITVTATIDAAGAFDNEASVDATEFDPDTANNTDDTGNGGTATDGATVDLAIAKSASAATVFLDQSFSFVVDITNLGPSTATDVVMTDVLPPSFALDSATSTQGSCTGTTTVTCTIGTMNAGATVRITLTGRPTAIGVLSNTASVAANEAETTMANNASTAAPQVLAAPIPTLGEWGLILLGIFLALVGVWFVKPQS
jgi:large repetitive protein